MIIDAHQHFWSPGRGDYGWIEPGSPFDRVFAPDDLAPLLDQCGIASTILVQAAPSEAETDFLLDLAARAYWIAGVVGWIDLTAADAVERINRRRVSPRFVGVRPMLQDLVESDWILGDAVAPALLHLAVSGVVFDALVRAPQLSHLAKLVDRFPNLVIVLDHAGKPPFGDTEAMARWHNDITALAARRQVACKLSGLLGEGNAASDRPAIECCIARLIDLFAPDRLIWGSDWPVLTAAGTYRDWFDLCRRIVDEHCSAATAAIFGGNARRIYHLDQVQEQ